MNWDNKLHFIRALRAAGYKVAMRGGLLLVTLGTGTLTCTVDAKRLSAWGDGKLVEPVVAIMADLV